ncbi:MAG TPA: ATP-binding protein [Candidatus Acidoferrales bacterium]|nr:ATP-binding protein [Candidatus Acidoferrales bacterium]
MVTSKTKSTRDSRAFVADSAVQDRGANATLHWDSIAPFADAGFKAVFDSSAEALLVVDAAGVIQKANPRAREVLRMREGNVAHSSLDDFVATLSTEKLTRMGIEEAPLPPAGVDALLASGSPVRVTLRAVLPGSGDMLLCIDGNSERERAERAEAELRAAVDSEAVVFFESSGAVRYTSPRFAELLGLDRPSAAIIASAADWKDLSERFRTPSAFYAAWQAFKSGDLAERRDELELLYPARRVLERTARPLRDNQGRAIGWVELFKDVTGERESETNLLQTEKMAALGRLVSGIAHELNNPLTTIMGYAQLLLGHGLSNSQLAEARNVYHEAERARRIVKNLLYFARENHPERTRVDLNDVVERALALRSYELRLENIAVICELAADLPPTMADPYQLQQVVLNLLVNAEHAMLEARGKGQVQIRTSCAGAGDERRLRLDIADDGPGIDPGIASRVFDPFFTTKPPGIGTGLGLSIVYGIIHQHGGEVTFESFPGEGAKFTLDLPVVAITQRETVPVAFVPALTHAVPQRGRILIVEDEPTVAQLLVDVLSEEGHEAEATVDGRDGLSRISRKDYDMVICDLRMPRLDGRAFYEALANTNSALRNRILFITGDTIARGTQEFLRSTGMPHLSKPFLVEEVKMSVRRLLETKAVEHAASR